MEKTYQFKEDMLQIHKKDRRDFSLAVRHDEYEIKNGFSITLTHNEAASILDKVEKLIYEERENVLATIPIVEFDSRLGWEPSMEYTTGVDGLNWKLRHLDHKLDFVLKRYRKSNDLIKNFV